MLWKWKQKLPPADEARRRLVPCDRLPSSIAIQAPIKTVKYLIIAISALILLALVASRYLVHRLSPSPHPTIKAVYFVKVPGMLDQHELYSHPEVIVTSSFDEVKQYAKWRVALWVDTSVVHKLTDEERNWFKAPPQAYYPMALIGYGDKMTSFKMLLPLLPPETLNGLPIIGELYPGYSVYQKDPDQEIPNIWQGYTYKPHVQDILDITNDL